MHQPVTMSPPLCCQLLKDALAIIRRIDSDQANAGAPNAAVVDHHDKAVEVSAQLGAHKPAIESSPCLHADSVEAGQKREHGSNKLIKLGEPGMSLADLALAYPDIYGEYS